MKYRIAWVEGDGIGPEITKQAIAVAETLQTRHSFRLDIRFRQAGDACKDRTGEALPAETLREIRQADAAVKGPVGETAADVIVKLRQMLDLYANIRPAKNYPGLPAIGRIDLVIVRENTEDLYKGLEFEVDGGAIGIRLITEKATRRIAGKAAEFALRRRGKVTIVHKANVMKRTCGLFSKVAKEELSRYPELSVDEMYVDAASMALIRKPERFDVILTSNLFGDILSDEAAQVAGGLGMAASGNLGDSAAIFEPVHGSAPDIAGGGLANPYSMVLSLQMMLEWLAAKKGDKELTKAARDIERATRMALESGAKTPDIGGSCSTAEVGRRLVEIITKLPATND
jgi:3-isopropylmalate dehydrogenase